MLHLTQWINAKLQNFTSNYCLDCELSLNQMFLRVPFIHLNLLILWNCSNNITNTKVITWTNGYIFTIFETWMNKCWNPLCQKYNFFYFFPFDEYILICLILPRLQQRANPCNKRWTLSLKELNFRIPFFINVQRAFDS